MIETKCNNWSFWIKFPNGQLVVFVMCVCVDDELRVVYGDGHREVICFFGFELLVSFVLN